MGENRSDKLHTQANRTSLGDITNHPGKRDFSLVSPCPNSPSKSGNQNKRVAKLNNGGSSDDEAFWKQVAFLLDKLKNETCGIPNCPNYTPDAHLSPVKHKDSDDPFWKEVALRVKELKMQPCGSAKCPKVDNEVVDSKGGKVRDPSANTVSLLGNAPTDICHSALEVKEPSSSAVDSVDLGERQGLPSVVTMDDVTLQTDVCNSAHEIKEPSSSAIDIVDLGERQVLPNVVNVDDITLQTSDPKVLATEDCKTCERNSLVGEKDSQCEKTRAHSDVVVIDDDTEGDLVDEVIKDNGKTRCVDYLTSNKLESGVSSRLSDPLGRKSFELERCTGLKGDGSATGLDLLNSCSCSFCTKAAYIWSDLHYEDVKGRISILMNSQKEASNLAQRYSSENTMGSHDLQNSNKATDLEIDLMGQWKSLFLHMESILVDESSQLQTNFLALKDLRDDFKMNMESINGMPSYVRPCSSDTSDHRII